MAKQGHFSTVEAPGLYVSERIANRALELGTTRMQASRTGVDEVIRLATTGQDLKVGALILRPREEVYATKSRNYFDISESGIEEALSGEPISYYDLRDQAKEAGVPTLDVHNQKPTLGRLTRGVYAAAARSTVKDGSFFTSHNDKVFGILTTCGLAMGADLFTGEGYTDSYDDVMSMNTAGALDIFGAPLAGVVIGATVITPLIGALRREVDVRTPQVAADPPIHLS